MNRNVNYTKLFITEIENNCLCKNVGVYELSEARVRIIIRRRNTESPGVQREICFPYRVHQK